MRGREHFAWNVPISISILHANWVLKLEIPVGGSWPIMTYVLGPFCVSWDLGSVPGFPQLSCVGLWGTISFLANVVHLLLSNNIFTNSHSSKTLRTIPIKLANVWEIEKHVSMIQNQSEVTKIQLNSNFSSFSSPSWCFPKATLLNYMCIVTLYLDRLHFHVKKHHHLALLIEKID